MPSGHQFEIDAMRDKHSTLSPVWAGVGCVLLLGYMTLGYFVGDWFLTANAENYWMVIPREFAWPPFAPFLSFKLIIAVMVTMICLALTSIVYAIANPPKPGKYDVINPDDLPPLYTKRSKR